MSFTTTFMLDKSAPEVGNVLDLWMSDNGGSCVLAVIGDGNGTGSLSELWQ
jgi:hypothetical protein